MSETKLAAETRTEFGKGAARRIRRADQIPAVLYGHGTDPSTSPSRATRRCWRSSTCRTPCSPSSSTAATQLALPKDVQRDPSSGDHRARRPARRPPRREGHRRRPGPRRRRGAAGHAGHLEKPDRSTLEAEATHIPESVEVAVEGLEAGTQIHAATSSCPRAPRWPPTPRPLVVNIDRSAPTAEALEAELAEAEAEAGIEHEEPEADRSRGRRGRRVPPRAADEAEPTARSAPRRRDAEAMAPTRRPGWSSGWVTRARRTPATGTTSAPWSSTSWPRRIGASVRARTRRGPTSPRGGSAPPAAPGPRVVLATPAVLHERVRRPGRRRCCGSSRCPPERLIVVHDELDIPFATLRLKRGGGDNGHNGLRSISKSAGHRRLLPGAGRHRPPARPDGPGRLRARATSRRPSARSCRSCSSDARRRRRASPRCRPRGRAARLPLALIFSSHSEHALEASGRAPAAWSPAAMTQTR